MAGWVCGSGQGRERGRAEKHFMRMHIPIPPTNSLSFSLTFSLPFSLTFTLVCPVYPCPRVFLPLPCPRLSLTHTLSPSLCVALVCLKQLGQKTETSACMWFVR